MVKNQKGGNKSKKMGRKFISAPVDRNVRMSQDENEIYATVIKIFGHGMFQVKDSEGIERMCVYEK